MVCQSHFHGHLSLFARLQESTLIPTIYILGEPEKYMKIQNEFQFPMRREFNLKDELTEKPLLLEFHSVEKVFVGKINMADQFLFKNQKVVFYLLCYHRNDCYFEFTLLIIYVQHNIIYQLIGVQSKCDHGMLWVIVPARILAFDDLVMFLGHQMSSYSF